MYLQDNMLAPHPPARVRLLWMRRRGKVGNRLLITTFLVLALASLHVGLSLRIGSRELFPYVGTFLSGVMLITLCRATIKLKSVAWLGLFFLIASLTSFGSFAIHAAPGETFGAQARGLLALGAALTSGYGTFLGLRALGRIRAAKLFWYLWLFIVVFSFLEVYGGLRPLSDMVREGLRPDRWLYELDLRDVDRYGALRPKVFAPEPSIVGYTAGLCLSAWFILGLRRRQWHRLVEFVLMAGITWFFVRSPAMVACLAAGVLAIPFHVFGRGHFITFRKLRGQAHPILAFLTLLGVVGIAIASVSASTYWGEEIGFFGTGSFFIRQVAPMLTEVEVLKQHLLLGTGVNGDHLLFPIVEQVYVENSAFIRFPHLFDMPVDILITNAFFSYWHALGLLGGGLGMLALYYFSMSTRALPMFVLAGTAVAIHAVGGMNNPRTWMIFFVLTAASSLAAPRFITLVPTELPPEPPPGPSVEPARRRHLSPV
ncbi:hypothetical protein [Geminicoccus roseus]|uniref:hypothetical protein n=1 Tax=Geminicoccus roseus TaxID=404900 RepID=UPI00146F98B2|nr:hypothetical protein [Geminicoccus roseus]